MKERVKESQNECWYEKQPVCLLQRGRQSPIKTHPADLISWLSKLRKLGWGAHRESCECLGRVCVCHRKEATWPDRKLDNLAMEPLFENTFRCGRSRLWETRSSRSLRHCWGCQLLGLYEGFGALTHLICAGAKTKNYTHERQSS